MISLVLKAKLKEPNKKLPKILVTGCAGSVGRMMDSVWSTVFDYDLIGIDRSPNIQRNFPWRTELLGHSYQELDYIFHPRQLGDLLKNGMVEKVAHLASIPREEANLDYSLAKRYNVEGTQILVNQIKKNCDLSYMHIFFGSCMSVYGDRRENPEIKVTDTPKPMDHDYFALTKLEAENIIKESGIPYTILRYAPICDHLNWWVDLHPSFFNFDLDQKIEWITARDSAKAIKLGMYKSKELNQQILNIGGGQQLIMRHRDFMKEIMNARGVMINKSVDFDPKAFANLNTFGGYFADSDDSNRLMGYRMQPIDTAYLRQIYRYPFIMRWINKKFSFNRTIKGQYEKYSHIYQAQLEKDTQFLANHFIEANVQPRDAVEQILNAEIEAELNRKDLLKRQLAGMAKKQKLEFEEEMKQRNIRDAIELKWRNKRTELILEGQNPDQINLDEVERLEAEEKLREEQTGGQPKTVIPEPKPLTEEELIRQKEIEEEERERERKIFGY